MRRSLRAAAVVAAAIVTPGCFVALHPLVTRDSQVFERAIVGTWAEKDSTSPDVWAFALDDEKNPTRYVVTITEPHRPDLAQSATVPLSASFTGRLGRIDGQLVLDITPEVDSALGPLRDHGTLAMNLVATHTVFRVRLDGDTLGLQPVDSAWLDAAIASKKIVVAHEHVGGAKNPHEPGQTDSHARRDTGDSGDVLITAPTSELQSLVRRFGKAGLFDTSSEGTFVRRRAPSAGPN